MKLEVRNTVDLKNYTSWQVGGCAEYYVAPTTVEQIREAVQWARAHNKLITILSGGSNVLISDEGIEGLVIHLQHFKSITHLIEGDRLKIVADSGCSKTEILKIFLKYRLAPALFLAGIPGDVGGGVVMNAGVGEQIEPREFEEIVDEIEVLDTATLNLKTYEHDDLEWTYRHSIGWQPGIITKVKMSWPLVQNEKILEEVKLANRNRFLKQPLEFPSCGSVFMNPPGLKSARLIDEAGLKGYTIGGAQVSTKHANFIINRGDAQAHQIDELIKHVQETVRVKAGVLLKTEVVYLGKW